MAKKVEKKKTVKKTTNKPTKKVDVVKEEFDDEEVVKPTKKMYKEKKSILPRRNKKPDVLGDSLLKQNAEIFNFFKILIGVLIFIGVFYLLVALARGEIGHKKETKQDEQPRTIQNQEILATSIFTKEDREYYVFIFDSESKKASFYATMYTDYVQQYPVISMFYVDINNGFNKDIVASDTTNPKAQKFEELKVASPTLIHIKNGKNIGYYENEKVADKMAELYKQQ